MFTCLMFTCLKFTCLKFKILNTYLKLCDDTGPNLKEIKK